jgi:hypothetical protein
VVARGRERASVGKKERGRGRRKGDCSGRNGIGANKAGTLLCHMGVSDVVAILFRWIPRTSLSLMPFDTPRAPAWLAHYAWVQILKLFSWRCICENYFTKGSK